MTKNTAFQSTRSHRVLRFAGFTLFLAALALSSPLAAQHHGKSGVSVVDAWARPPLTPTGAGAAYLTIINSGHDTDRLIGAKTGVSKRARLHTHILKDGVARMRSVEAIAVNAGGKVEMKPGGHHVMLMGVHGTLKTGGSFPMTLIFEKAGEIVVDVKVRSVTVRGHGDHGDHASHGGMAEQAAQAAQAGKMKMGHSGHDKKMDSGGHGQMKKGHAATANMDTATTKLSEGNHYRVSIRPQAGPVKINAMHSWVVELRSPDGKPIEGAKLAVDGGMPAHGHGLPTAPKVTKSLGDGKYLVEGVRFNMAGAWELKLNISGHHRDQVTFNLVLK